jgi:hypothetical protein
VISNGGTGGAGGAGDTKNRTQSGSGGKGADGGPAGSVKLTLGATASVNSATGQAIVLSANGGAGGDGGEAADSGMGGRGGAAGAAGPVLFHADAASIIQTSSEGVAVRLQADGGLPGVSQPSSYPLTSNDGPGGAAGGAGGAVDGLFGGTIKAAGTAVVAQSVGSSGGDGASSYTGGLGTADGGTGGNGGSAGAVTLQFLPGSSTTAAVSASGGKTAAENDTLAGDGIALSVGGAGGAGGPAEGGFGKGNSGQGGLPGDGGAATIDAEGATITASGGTAVGLLAESVGGHGGNSALANSIFVSVGGKGAAGGSSGAATVDVGSADIATQIATMGTDSAGLVAESIAGGGGYGGSASALSTLKAVSLGGNGGAGGVAGPATVSVTAGPGSVLAPTVLTDGLRSPALVAQSIGGGGGTGGSVSAVNLGVFSLTIGGFGGAGGVGGMASATNQGTVQTEGSQSPGLEAQSVGGGGGNGGAAYSLQVGAQYDVALAIGGHGGQGGEAATATAKNDGQIVTLGDDSFGMEAQSIGGGGGNGGASFSEAVQLFSSADVEPEIPSVLLNSAVGGNGGKSGNGSTVLADNEGSIITTQGKSDGIVAQSIGGGGGEGGDSSVVNVELQAPSVTATAVVGGTGGDGGNGGDVTATNSGFILTLGTIADGVLAQSVGGGGGDGGYAQADTGAFFSGSKTAQITVAVGGSGGNGGNGGAVSVYNTLLGGIATRGDGASGISAESIGGGGGNGDLAAALGSGGGTLNVNVAVGGAGGGGGTGGSVLVDNHGAIFTAGASAPGISAQSIGGGGGNGGDAASGAGTDPEVRASNFIASGLGVSAPVVSIGDGVYTWKDNFFPDSDVIGTLKTIVTSYDKENAAVSTPAQEGAPAESESLTVDVGAGYARAGGSAGSGGNVALTNAGAIETQNTDSDGISAQSIGGGGGAGGVSNPAPSNSQYPKPTTIDAAVGVGGQGGSAGNGGQVNITDTGSIVTNGDVSSGIDAQSIGGGGGTGGMTLAQSGILSKLTVALGGNGGSKGNGGAVNIDVGPVPDNAGNSSDSSSILTTGADAPAILAQSIGGGGGVAALMGTTVPSNSGGRGQSNTGIIGSITIPSTPGGLVIDGAQGSSGNGGPINIVLNKSSSIGSDGYLQTYGADSYDVLAQSIGGGGGLVIGAANADPYANLRTMFSPHASEGNGGTVNVTVEHDFSMGTAGAGAIGILAQSIGGGGLIGGLGNVNLASGIVATPTPETGQGGNVTVDLESGGNLTTTGAGADGIVAMSLGGGAGMLDQANGAGFVFAGSTPFNARDAGVAPTGTVDVTVGSGTLVRSSGANAYPIYAASQGNGTNAVQINVASYGSVQSWGQSPAAIFVAGAGGVADNVINNAGTIDDGTMLPVATTQTPNATGVAISGTAPVTVNNTGVIDGGITNGGGSMFNNEQGGTFNPGSVINLGPVTPRQLSSSTLFNSGRLTIGSASNNMTTTTLSGNLVQSSTGTIVFRLNAETNQADQLIITGSTQLAGHVNLEVIDPADLKPSKEQQVQVLQSDITLDANALSADTSSPVLQIRPIQTSQSDLRLFYTINMNGGGKLQAAGLGSENALDVGNALNAIQDGDGAPGLAPLIDAAVNVPSAQALAALYDSLSGDAVADDQQVIFGDQQAYQDTIVRHVLNQDAGSPVVGAGSSHGQPTEVWVAGLGRSDMLSGANGQGSVHSQSAGALAGIDHHTDDGQIYGLSVGGGTSNFSVSQEESQAHDTSVNIAAYGIAWRGSFYLSGVASYGNFWTSLNRGNIAAAAGLPAYARQNFSSSVAGGRVELGWSHPIDALTVNPYAAIDLDELWQGAFSEQSLAGSTSGLALRYGNVSELSAPLTLRARLTTTILFNGNRRFTPYIDLGFVHEFNTTRSVDASFLAAPDTSFQVFGAEASRNAASTNVGGTFELTPRLSLSASFNGLFSGVETSCGGSGGLQYAF